MSYARALGLNTRVMAASGYYSRFLSLVKTRRTFV